MKRATRLFLTSLSGGVAVSGSAAQADLRGQSAAEWVEELELSYNAAKDLYTAALGQSEVIERQWERLLSENERASEAEDERRIKQVLAEIQDLSPRRTRATGELNARKEEWYVAYDALKDAYDAYLEILLTAILQPPVGSQGEERDLYNEYEARLEAKENEVGTLLGPRHSLELPPMRDIEIREGDTREDIELKARGIDNRVEQLDRLVSNLDREIDYLVRRQRRNRTREDAQAGVRQFDDVVVPVVPPSQAADATRVTGVGDTTVVNILALPLEVRIERLESTREAVINQIEELREKARDFRERARRIP